MAQVFSYVIDKVGTNAGSLIITINSDNPYYLMNIRNAKVATTGTGTAGTVVLIFMDSGIDLQFPYLQINTIGGAPPSNLADAAAKLAALIAL